MIGWQILGSTTKFGPGAVRAMALNPQHSRADLGDVEWKLEKSLAAKSLRAMPRPPNCGNP